MTERMELEENDHKRVVRNMLRVLKNIRKNMNTMIRGIKEIKRRPKWNILR